MVPIDGNIDSRKYVKVLDENLWPVVCKNLNEHHISGFTWPAYKLKIIKNVCKVIKFHVQKDLSAVKSRQDLIVPLWHLLWTPAQRKRASMLYFANVFYLFIYFFMAALFSGPG